jgi:hypothetical protein
MSNGFLTFVGYPGLSGYLPFVSDQFSFADPVRRRINSRGPGIERILGFANRVYIFIGKFQDTSYGSFSFVDLEIRFVIGCLGEFIYRSSLFIDRACVFVIKAPVFIGNRKIKYLTGWLGGL